MNKRDNAVRAIEYLDSWLKATNTESSTCLTYEYLCEVAQRIEEMFEIYENGKLLSISTDDKLASLQKDYT